MTISVEAVGSERPPSMELIRIRNAFGPSIALTPVGGSPRRSAHPGARGRLRRHSHRTAIRFTASTRRPVLSGDGLTTCPSEAGQRQEAFRVLGGSPDGICAAPNGHLWVAIWRQAKFAASARKETYWLW